MSTPNTQQLEYNWLQNWHEVDSKNFNGAQLEWLNLEMNDGALNQKQVRQLKYNFLRRELGLTKNHEQPKNYNDLLKSWLSDQGMTDANHNDMWSEYFQDAEALGFQVLGPRLDGTISIEPQRGTGSATFTRDDSTNNGIYTRDFENNYRKVADGEARFQGARRVENLANYSEDFSQAATWGTSTATITTGVTDKDGGTTAATITATGANQILKHGNIIVELGIDATTSIWVRRRTGTGTINLIQPSGAAYEAISITSEWKRFTLTAVTTSTILYLWLQVVTSGDEVDVCFSQAENTSGQSNQTPSEYVATGLVAASKYFWRTNGNTVASNVVTEAVGLDLHPTSYKLGAKVFDRYNKWAATTVYAVGDRIIPATGSGPSGGNGYYYECTTGGTSDASEPTFGTTVGGSTSETTVVWENKGLYTVLGYLVETTRTNEITYSYDLTQWTPTGTAVSALDEVGIDGVANKATTLTDDDVASAELVTKTATIPNDSNTHTSSYFIKKDVTATGYNIAIDLFVSGGTMQRALIHFSLVDGSSASEISTGTVGYWTEDRGDWWRFVVQVDNNTTGNTTATCSVVPARGTVLGTGDATATGSCIVGHAQLELNENTPTSPIETTGTTEGRNADALSYSTDNVNLDEGSSLCSYTPLEWYNANLSVLGYTFNSGLVISAISTAEAAIGGAIRDQTNISSISAGPSRDQDNPLIVILGSRWSLPLAEMQAVGTDATSGALATYDGDFGMTTLQIGQSNAIGGGISDVLIYNKDLGTTKLESMTEYD